MEHAGALWLAADSCRRCAEPLGVVSAQRVRFAESLLCGQLGLALHLRLGQRR